MSIGKELLIEYQECNVDFLNDTEKVQQALLAAAKEAGVALPIPSLHQFAPYGVSGVVLGLDSHFAIHTWPEYAYASVDVFALSDLRDPYSFVASMAELLGSKKHSVTEISRGVFALLPPPVSPNCFSNVPLRPDQETAQYTYFHDLEGDDRMGTVMRLKPGTLSSEKAKGNKVEVATNDMFGKVLIVNNQLYVTEHDERLYHEMMVHPALFGRVNIKRVLVLGGGDGGVAREVLRHSNVERVVVVEENELLVDMSKKHFPLMANSFSDARVELVIGCPADFVA